MTATKHCFYSYSIDEHPNPQAAFDWMREHFDLADYCVEDAMATLRAFCNFFQVDLKDWAISSVPDRGERIVIRVHEDLEDMAGVRLWKYLTNNFEAQHPGYLSGTCPLTGMCYDENALDPIREFMARPDNRTWPELVNECAESLLAALHADGEYRHTEEAMREDCEANEWEFYENGSIA